MYLLGYPSLKCLRCPSIMCRWLYQFWYFGFQTAKHWGWGPRYWTAQHLRSKSFYPGGLDPAQNTQQLSSLVGDDWLSCDDSQVSHDALAIETPAIAQSPTSLCRWSLHVREYADGKGIDVEFRPDEWPSEWIQPPIEERLKMGLEQNYFSTVESTTVPFDVPQLVKSVVFDSKELMQQSLCFAIMARNYLLVEDLMDRLTVECINLSSLYPLHLATTYLDGVSECCNILDLLCEKLPVPHRIWENAYGHTVLDNLMITILRAHSTASLDVIDKGFGSNSYLAGIELDPCGRWDADSPCWRDRVESRRREVPPEWKHKFCHTSAQAVCHCIAALDSRGLPLSRQSGIFTRRCTSCGFAMRLLPLHLLTLTTFYLGEAGCDGEDFFGMIAVLLALLSCGLRASSRAEISTNTLIDMETNHGCEHQLLTPLQMSERFPHALVSAWSNIKRTGWEVFREILREAESTEIASFEADEMESTLLRESTYHFPWLCDSSTCGWQNSSFENLKPPFGKSMQLGHTWAAVQSELLIYRREAPEDPWISSYFDLSAVLLGLKTGNKIAMPLIADDMMESYCMCGNFDVFWAEIPLDSSALTEKTRRDLRTDASLRRCEFIHLPERQRRYYNESTRVPVIIPPS